MNEYLYMPCEGVEPTTLKPNGVWHFCCVTTSKLNQQLIYPLGYCRKNKCKHKTAQAACDCFRMYEIENDTHVFTGLDFIGPNGQEIKGRKDYRQCRSCGEQTTGYCQVGIQQTEYYMCEKHMNVEELEKVVPIYQVNIIKK